jgi:hypothetical protein
MSTSSLNKHELEKTEAGPLPMKVRTKINIAIVVFYFTMILGTVAVVGAFTGDCISPLRNWLILQVVIMFLHMCGALAIEIVDYRQRNKKEEDKIDTLDQVNIYIIQIGGIVYFIWWIVGQVWYFSIGGCSDFEAGYMLTMVYIIVNWVLFGVALIFGLKEIISSGAILNASLLEKKQKLKDGLPGTDRVMISEPSRDIL